jgi:hypothetical protein
MNMITRAIGRDVASAGQVCPVNSHNEWDPLKARGCDHPVRSSGCDLQHSRHDIGTKPFCRGDETVLKQVSEYRLLIRLGRPKCNLSSISFGRSRAADISLQWVGWRASSDRGFCSCSRGDQLGDLRCARAGCLSHWLA